MEIILEMCCMQQGFYYNNIYPMKPLVSQTDATLCLYSQEGSIASVSVIDNFPIGVIVRLMVFNNFKVISCWSVLLAEETRVPGENQVTEKLYHTMLYC